MLPSVAIVILNWNGKRYLEQFLPFVSDTTYNNYSIVLADNASIDDSVIFVKEKYPGIRIIVNPVNEGFAKGYNLALQQVDADYYVLLNNDVEVTAGWLEPVIALMESDKAIACCQPKMLSFANKEFFEYAGACGGWIDTLGYPFSRGRIFETCERDTGQYDNASEVFWASGAAFIVRSAVFHECNGFDEYFFAHQEEIDLCWRMKRLGYKIYVQPASVVYHVGGGTLAMGDSRKAYLNFRNNLIMLCKNSSFSKLIWKLPLRINLDYVAIWRAIFAGEFKIGFAIVKAHFQFLKWLLFVNKKKQSGEHPIGDHQGIYKGSIVWEYFFRKRKTFSSIMRS